MSTVNAMISSCELPASPFLCSSPTELCLPASPFLCNSPTEHRRTPPENLLFSLFLLAFFNAGDEEEAAKLFACRRAPQMRTGRWIGRRVGSLTVAPVFFGASLLTAQNSWFFLAGDPSYSFKGLSSQLGVKMVRLLAMGPRSPFIMPAQIYNENVLRPIQKNKSWA